MQMHLRAICVCCISAKIYSNNERQMLVSRIEPGNLRRYNMTNHLNIVNVRENFLNLVKDPYIKDGYRRKHLVRYMVTSKNPIGLKYLKQEPLFQRKQFNPVHGDMQRYYPRFSPTSHTLEAIKAFVKLSSVQEGQRILVQVQRITCEDGKAGLPSVEDWHQDDVSEIGIMCVSRHNIIGGENQFRDLNGYTVLNRILDEGELVIFEDAQVKHRVTPITVAHPTEGGGYRDVLLMSYGGST